MKVLIYGGGAVGLGIAASLIKSGQEVTVLARERVVKLLKSEGLFLSGLFGEYTALPGTFHFQTSLGEQGRKHYDYILICVKSFDSESAARDLRDHNYLLGQKGKILLCQNGWGNGDIFAAYFHKKQIFHARVITGFTLDKPNRVRVTVHADAMKIGSLYGVDPAVLTPLAEGISGGGYDCQVNPEVEKDLWAKMIYNCALNSLGAVMKVPYGILEEYEESRGLMNEIIMEIYAVMRKAGYSTYYKTADDYIYHFYSQLIPRTAEHYSSTLQDIMADKPIEIDALNGEIVRMGKRLGVSVPANRFIYKMVKLAALINKRGGLQLKL